ncbi:nose resistant to fluoxetine protein 6-like [Porites lutea]|uniref:nose resistant to fluoxetine protein 6-like n=1 Tax=Porites lutea TaxID=51062 RepID=UPI003CC607F2
MRLLFVSNLLIFCVQLASGVLPKHAIREISGLDKANRFVLPVTANGEVSSEPFLPNVSQPCKDALSKPLTQLIPYEDASGKPESGVTGGNLVWLGSYSLCQNISEAHYCLAPKITLEFQGFKAPAEWGLCVPSNCSERDVAFGFSFFIKPYVGNLPFVKVSLDKDMSIACAHPSKWTTGPIITLVICAVIACLCLAGTAVDLLVVQGSWKFWVTAEEPRQAEENDFHISSNQTEPLLINNGLSERTGLPSVQYMQPSLEERGFLIQLLTCFSVARNASKIMDCTVPPGAITCLNGVRVLSMWWVILGHTYLWLLLFRILNNLGLALNITHRFSFEAVNSAFFSVDSFFLLSGLLVAYLGFRRMDKNNGRLPLFQFYFHRFWRLTPSYMFVILFYHNLMKFLGDGPLWYGIQQPTTCGKYWWTNLLYINNFHPNSLAKECLGWSWYLANDMQFYIISPLLLFIIYRLRWIGLGAGVGGLLTASLLVTGVLIGHYNTDVLEAEQIETGFKKEQGRGSYTDVVYIKPYCRITPYLVGIALGYLLFIEKSAPAKNPLNKIPRQLVCLVGWFVGAGLGITVVYGIYTVNKKGGRPFNQAENIIYGTFSRFVWGLAVAWVVYACHKGYGSLVNKFLSASYWIPLSRLTYSAYLLHPIVMNVYFGSFQHTTEYTDKIFALYFVSIVVFAYASAFVLAVCVEYPTMQLEKVLFFRNKNSGI